MGRQFPTWHGKGEWLGAFTRLTFRMFDRQFPDSEFPQIRFWIADNLSVISAAISRGSAIRTFCATERTNCGQQRRQGLPEPSEAWRSKMIPETVPAASGGAKAAWSKPGPQNQQQRQSNEIIDR